MNFGKKYAPKNAHANASDHILSHVRRKWLSYPKLMDTNMNEIKIDIHRAVTNAVMTLLYLEWIFIGFFLFNIVITV